MEFIQIHPHSKIRIRSYEPGAVQINDETYHKSLIVLPDHLILDWPVHNIAELTVSACQAFLKFDCDVLLIGTGPTLVFPQAATKGYLSTQVFGVEYMDTGAACRTFHVLLSEHRQVAAALII